MAIGQAPNTVCLYTTPESLPWVIFVPTSVSHIFKSGGDFRNCQPICNFYIFVKLPITKRNA